MQSLDPGCGGPCDSTFEGGPTLELSGIASIGRQRFTPQTRRNDRYPVMETASFFRAGHTVKAGAEFNHMENPVFQLPLHFGGRFIFSALPANPAILITNQFPRWRHWRSDCRRPTCRARESVEHVRLQRSVRVRPG